MQLEVSATQSISRQNSRVSRIIHENIEITFDQWHLWQEKSPATMWQL